MLAILSAVQIARNQRLLSCMARPKKQLTIWRTAQGHTAYVFDGSGDVGCDGGGLWV